MVIEAKAIYLSAVLEVVASEISHNPHNQTTPPKSESYIATSIGGSYSGRYTR